MKQLSIGEKLYAIRSLTAKDIGKQWVADIHNWFVKAGENYDTTVLSDQAVEQINTLYHENFY